MTMIDVDTSPLQAAREWRGIGLVAAAMTSGIPVAQAEALEEGDPDAFGSIDEMIAAAVVYGSSIGIGRDEAMALLDRTVCRTGARVALPDATPGERPNAEFSGAVHERSARIAVREPVSTTPISPDVPADELLEPSVGATGVVEEDAPAAVQAELPALPAVPEGPSPEQAVAASGEIHIDDDYRSEPPWERSGYTSELEAWAEDLRDEDDAPLARRQARTDGIGERFGAGAHAALERVLGTERADAAASWTRDAVGRARELARDGRERLRRSEHATLFLAIGGGAVLIALLVALGGAIGGDETAGPGPADRTAGTAAADPAAGTEAATEKPAGAAGAAPVAQKAMLPPARTTVDVFNAGSKKGYAKEVAAKLEALGYRVDKVTNAENDYPGATIIHPRDLGREAKLLARRTGISTLQVAPGSTRTITIVVT